MLIVGLTGSIGMGKSTTAALFKRFKIPVFDADATVHRLQYPGHAGFRAIADAFPDVIRQGRIDRQALGMQIFANPAQRERLEAILHPLVRKKQQEWLGCQARRRASRQQRKIVVLDIPLLFETGGFLNCDAIVVVDAPLSIQRQRVLARRGMSADKFAHILKSQMPQRLKKRGADFVVPTGRGIADTFRHLRLLIKVLQQPVEKLRLSSQRAMHPQRQARVWGRKSGYQALKKRQSILV
jgi:dephospho-CoA kinase